MHSLTLRFPQLADMVLVPAEEGSTPRASPSERDDLLVDRFEVTDAEFADFVAHSHYAPRDATGYLSHWRASESGPSAPDPARRDLPVRHVSLEDAEAYAAWRGKSIPTREEWERACPSLRGGDLPWRGRALTAACNSVESELFAPTPVGTFELGRSPCGCYDMIGNVREWTTTSGGRHRRVVLGGSFRRRCRHTEVEQFDDLLAPDDEADPRRRPWVEAVALDARADDLGFRCVVRDAARVVDLAVRSLEPLRGAERTDAIGELLHVGTWLYGDNRVLPHVLAHAFERRVRWSVDLADATGGVAPFHVLPRRADLDEILVASDHTIARLSPLDGHGVGRVTLPFDRSALRAEWFLAPDGAAALWCEDEHGRVARVEVPSGRTVVVPPPSDGREVRRTWLATEPAARGATWFVQKLDVLRPGPGGALVGDEPRVRVVRIGEEKVEERTLAGELTLPPSPAGRDGLLLPLWHQLELTLPIGAAAHELDPFVEWASVERVAVVGGAEEGELAATTEWFAAGTRRHGSIVWRFARGDGSDAPRVEVDAPDVDSDPIEPTTRPATFLVTEVDGRRRLMRAGRRELGALLLEDGTDAHGLALPTSDEARDAPSRFLADEGATLLELRDDERLHVVARGLSPAGQFSWRGLDPSARRLVERSKRGEWSVRDLAHGGVAPLAVADASAIDTRVVALGATTAIACQTTPTSAWILALDGAPRLDAFAVNRPAIGQVVALDVDHDGTPDPLVRLDDGRLVLLGRPDDASSQLLDDFLAAARAGASDEETLGKER